MWQLQVMLAKHHLFFFHILFRCNLAPPFFIFNPKSYIWGKNFPPPQKAGRPLFYVNFKKKKPTYFFFLWGKNRMAPAPPKKPLKIFFGPPWGPPLLLPKRRQKKCLFTPSKTLTVENHVQILVSLSSISLSVLLILMTPC